MNLSTQLRIILLLVGAAIWLAIYLYGKRKATQGVADTQPVIDAPQAREAPPGFTPAEALDDDEFETPAYMRRQGAREPRQDYEPRIADAHDYVDMDEVRDDARQFVADEPDHTHIHRARDYAEPAADLQHEPVYTGSRFDDPVYVEPAPIETAAMEPTAEVPSSRREPTVTLDEVVVTDTPVEYREPEPWATDEPVRIIEAEPPTLPNIPIVEHPVTAAHGYVQPDEQSASLSSSMAPTLSDAVTARAERVVARNAPFAPPATAATPATSTGKTTGNSARRKIIALRVPMPERVPGVQLLSLLQGERLQHGKFRIFHRMQDAGTVFSVASMVEPGTFDPQVMSEQQFAGVTLFMMLPGPLDGLVAWDQMLSCAQRIAHATGGVLQDERGSKLTPQTMERLRDEVLDFQHLIGGMAPAT